MRLRELTFFGDCSFLSFGIICTLSKRTEK